MKYTRFVISNYRAITGPMTIDFRKQSLIPIIGINESGKTTVLQALFAFDYLNDSLNDNGRHLKDTKNLYRNKPQIPTITAFIQYSKEDIQYAIENIEGVSPEDIQSLKKLKSKKSLPKEVAISRQLDTNKYRFTTPPFSALGFQDQLARAFIIQLPYILYFDDFRDRVDEFIEIPKKGEEPKSPWYPIIKQLFLQTEDACKVTDLPSLEERQRRSMLAKVQRHLNQTLTKEWQHFRLDDVDALQINVDYFERDIPGGGKASCLRLVVVDRDVNGDDHFFYISDRSKGFFWFFNFVMKLEFNPKFVTDSDAKSIYLLDEPGSYLHATAQAKLCSKLRTLSEKNKVVYCTHSHYLLDPEVIPLSGIVVADKDGNGNISLYPIHAHKGSILERRSAFQPVIDALHIKPIAMDIGGSRVVVVEGIYDYYSLELFRQNRPILVLPSVGADSVKFYISLLIAWQVKFRALWDNDKAGRAAHAAAVSIFGDDLAKGSFLLLQSSAKNDRIIQNCFFGDDLRMFRDELGIDSTSSFEKTIAAVFFSPRRFELINGCSAETRKSFADLWDLITDGL